MNTLSELTALCPPPAETPPVDWAAVENTLGMRLPEDYRELASTYGPGTFCGFIHVYHPCGATRWVDLTGSMPTTIREQLQHALDEDTFPVPHNPQHLFPVGVTDNGEHLFWITEPREQPHRWRVTVNEARGPRWHTFDGTLTSFLTAVLTGRELVPMFPRDLLDEGVTFAPSRPGSATPEAAPQPTGSINASAVRTWARDQGYDVPERGRIPGPIIEAWKLAHGR